jgi:hypothetical protein
MKAAVMYEAGGPEVFKIEEVNAAKIDQDSLLIVAASDTHAEGWLGIDSC